MKGNPEKAPVLMPIRTPNEELTVFQCQPGYACFDLENLKKLLKNAVNTETYIKQLENLLNELAEPVKGN